MANIKEVRNAFEEKLQAIFDLDNDLVKERVAIRRKAFREGRPLKDVEVARRKKIAATRQELSNAVRTLALETVDALENASDVEALLAEVKAVNQQLANDLKDLGHMNQHAKKAAKVAKSLTNVAEMLTGGVDNEIA